MNSELKKKETKIKIDWYNVEAGELSKELEELKSDTYYKDCNIYVNGELV